MYSYLSGLTLSLGVSFLFEVLDTLDFFSANDSSLYEIFIAERFIFFFFFFFDRLRYFLNILSSFLISRYGT